MPPEIRHPGARAVRPGRDPRTPSPPLRIQQPISPEVRGHGPRDRRQDARRPPGGNGGSARAPASLVPGLPEPTGIHLHAAYRPAALHRLRAGGAGVQGGTYRAQTGGDGMKLCGFEVGLDKPLFLIAGPCVIESMQLQLDVAGKLKEITGRLGVPFIFKSSFDKANRTSGTSFRGPGLEEGLKVLGEVKRQIGVPVLTDVHEYTPMDEVASVVDVLQTPAFLCRQADFILNVAKAGKPVNIK